MAPITREQLEAQRAELQALEREQWGQLNQTLGALALIDYYLQALAEDTDFGISEVTPEESPNERTEERV